MPKVIQMWEYGDPSVLKFLDITLRNLLPTEIRFQMLAAAVNRADIEIRSGKWPIMAENPFPYTLGLEAVGEVVEVGQGVASVKVGDRVITMMQKLGGIHGLRAGSYQEFVTVEAETVAVIPGDLNPLDVAALGLAAVTAYNGIKRLHIQPEQTVVIHGASGGVGSVAVSMAKALKARVLATTSNLSKEAYLREIGADEVIDLGNGRRLTDTVSPRSVDAVFEVIGQQTFSDSVAALKQAGHLCLVGAASGANLCFVAWDLLQDLHLTGYSSENLTGEDLRLDMEQICDWLASCQVPAPSYKTFPLQAAAHVHSLMEERKLTGRALLVP
ncbi:MAG: zinc-binding dehydrogenase [Cyanobacteriota bacterium]|nr:zinc-binding dehydrogenase [Cyanobacteriota bacterium]